jgi:ribosomal protein L7/L12
VLNIQIQKATDGATGVLQPSMQISASATAAPHQVQSPQQVHAPQQLPHRPPSRGNPIPSGTQQGVPMAQPGQRSASSPSVPIANPRQISQQPHAPQPVASPIMGLESLEELEPLEQFPPVEHKSGPRVPRAVTAPPRSPGMGVPLPDVPVLHNQAPRPSGLPDVPQAAPLPAQVSAPMDLEVFEQKVSSSGIFRAPVAADLAAADDGAAAEEYSENGATCSVFMGKSSNARVHQLFAELTGMSVQEANRACQKAIVAIAKDISEADAHNIKGQFAAINVQVRITKRK